MTDMLSVAELALIRTDTQGAVMPSTAVIMRPNHSSDGMGGYTDTYTAVGTAVCRVGKDGLSKTEQLIANKLTGVTPYMLTTVAGTDIGIADRVVVSTVTYEVAAVFQRESWETARRAMLVEVID